MLDACSENADSGWLLSEESLHLMNVLGKNVDEIGIPSCAVEFIIQFMNIAS